MSEAAPPSLAWSREDDGSVVLSPGGAWRISESAALQREVDSIQPTGAHAVVIDGSALGSLDTFAAFTLLAFVRRVGVARDAVAFRKMQERHRNLLALVIAHLDASRPPRPPRRVGVVARVGAAAISVYRMLLARSGFFASFPPSSTVVRALVTPFQLSALHPP
jgi:anti-anti-sigma regulatory factor